MRHAIIRIAPLVLFLVSFHAHASATTGTISHSQHFAWNSTSGWVNWDANDSNVSVTDTALKGYVWSANHGWINLSPTHGGVLNDGEGNLSGFAWDSIAGWIDFTGVHISADGVFFGKTTSNPKSGIMTFDCTHCAVVTDWRPLSVRTAFTTPDGSGGGDRRRLPNSINTPTPPHNVPAPEPQSRFPDFGNVTPPTEDVASAPISLFTASPDVAISTTSGSAVLSADPENLFDVEIGFGASREMPHWLLWIILAVSMLVGAALWRAIAARHQKKVL